MATHVKTSAMVFPYSLGLFKPGASFGALSLPLTQNILPTNNDDSPDYRFNGIWVQAHPDNGGYIYICNSALAPDPVDFTNVIGILRAGEWYPRSKEWANNRDLRGIFVGASDATSFAIALIDQF